ncbi:hypothetical protein ABPG72_001015 [Tetrahymena utriculariae]
MQVAPKNWESNESPGKSNQKLSLTQKQKSLTQSVPQLSKTFKLPGIVSPAANESLLISSTKTQAIQPSRYGLKEKLKPIEYKPLKVLGDLENKVEGLDIIFRKQDPTNENIQRKIHQYTQSIEPMMMRIKQPNEFKLKPLRRVESDFQMFKDIFVQPQQQRLNQLNQNADDKEENDDLKFADSAERFFHNSKNEASQLQLSKNQSSTQSQYISKANQDKKNVIKFNQSEVYSLLNNSINLNQSLKEDLLIKQGATSPKKSKKMEQSIQFNISMLEQSLNMETNSETQKQFFDQLIQVQPPDLPNSTVASPISPGNGYAPAIPLVTNFDETSKHMLKDLLVRAKAGQQAGDVQKEAHLSFYLGMVYDNQKKYLEASKHYKKFYTCARLMEDKIGMALGANRIGCDYFHLGEYDKSIEYHQINVQYSDVENSFAGFYNLGISQRKNGSHLEAIKNFKICLKWARERDELESECLSLGQLAVANKEVGQTEDALFNFTDCYEISKKLKKVKLQLDCLLHITKLLSLTAMKNSDNSIKVLRDAVECAKLLDDKKTAALCLCNLGVMEGQKLYETYAEEFRIPPSIEDWGDDESEEEGINGQQKQLQNYEQMLQSQVNQYYDVEYSLEHQ